jgi:hypothetical protein
VGQSVSSRSGETTQARPVDTVGEACSAHLVGDSFGVPERPVERVEGLPDVGAQREPRPIPRSRRSLGSSSDLLRAAMGRRKGQSFTLAHPGPSADLTPVFCPAWAGI